VGPPPADFIHYSAFRNTITCWYLCRNLRSKVTNMSSELLAKASRYESAQSLGGVLLFADKVTYSCQARPVRADIVWPTAKSRG
jgi:hypothetical protein